MAEKFSREQLERVAAEMNDIMGLTPPMDFDAPDDGTLFDTIVDEARGRGEVKDAIRADDFKSDDPEKKVFSTDVHRFFVEAGVWNARTNTVVMAVPAKAEPAPAPVKREKPAPPVDRKAETAEAKAQVEMEAGEDEPAAAAAGKPEPAAKKPVKKEGKTAPAAKAPAAKEDAVSTKKAAAKKPAKKTAAKKDGAFKNQGIGALTRELIAKHPDMGNIEIAEMVNKKLGTATPPASVAWHRAKMAAGKKPAKKAAKK